MRRHFVASLLILVGTAVSEAKEPVDHSQGSLRPRVEALARFTRVESAAIGEGGQPSKIWAAYEAVAKQAGRDDTLNLLRHRSPVVRTYLAWHVLRKMQDD